MFTSKKGTILVFLAITISLLLSACATPTPEVIEKEVVVTKIVVETREVEVEGETQIVEVTKVVEVVVTQVVEVEVTQIVEVEVEAPKWTGPGFGGILHFALGSAPDTADFPTVSTSAGQPITMVVNETLFALSENYKPIPMLVDTWELSDDGTTYTFHLRQGIKFHNGQEMTAEDVVASYYRFLEVSPRAGSFGVVESCEATDKYTVVFKLVAPGRVFLTNLSSVYADLAIQPKSIIEGKAAGELDVPDEIVGTGPYRIASWEPDTLIILERFEDYQPLPGERDGSGGAKIPYFDQIYYHIVPDKAAMMAGFEAGEFDVIWEFSQTQYKTALENPDIEGSSFYPGGTPMLNFNHSDKFAGDINFRQAILASLDMEEVALLTFGGDATLFKLSPYLWPEEGAMYLPHDPVAEAAYDQRDVEKGKELLALTDYAGEELIFISSKDIPANYEFAVAMSEYLKRELGLNITVEVLDLSSWLARWGEPEGWHLNSNSPQSYTVTPLALQAWWSCDSGSVARGFYCNEEMDAAFEAVTFASTEEAEEAAWRIVQRIFWEDLPWLKVADRPVQELHRADLQGFAGWYRPRFVGVWRE